MTAAATRPWDALRAWLLTPDASGRLERLRKLVLGALAAQTLLTLVYVVAASGRDSPFDAWYQPGFPSNLVVVHYHGSRDLPDVRVVLDDRFEATIPHLAPGPNGLQIDRDFAADGRAPAADYRPTRLEVRVKDDHYEVPLGIRTAR